MNVDQCAIYEHCCQEIEKHPELREEIIELYTLAMDEIEDGGSYENEFSHLLTAIEDLLEEEDEPS